MSLKYVAALCALVALSASAVMSNVIINDATLGWYNTSLGTSLDMTNPYGDTYLFPGPNYGNSNPADPNYTGGDPTINSALAPDLSSVSSILGSWLTDPSALNSNWTYESIPYSWDITTETAIVYKFDAGSGSAFQNVVANFGVDNGIFVYLDGNYKMGDLAPGGVNEWEYTVDLGNLNAGPHYLEVLREDHGGSDGYAVEVDAQTTQVPEPATLSLFLLGIASLAAFGIRDRKRRR